MTIDEMRRTLRISTTAFDDDIYSLADAAIDDMRLAGIVIDDPDDSLIKRAILTYLRLNFGPLDPQVSQKLKEAYDEQKKQLLMAHDTYRGEDNGTA